MDWSLIIFIAVVVFFAYRGYTRGLLKSLSRMISLLAGYIATILYTGQVVAIAEALFQLQGLVAFIAAALFLFIAAGIAVSFIFLVIGKLISENETPSAASSYAGAVLGLLIGVIVGFAIVWTFAFVRDIRPTAAVDALANTEKSSIESLANRLASKAVTTAMSLVSAKPEVVRMSAAIVEAPAAIAQQAQRVARSEDLTALFGNPQNQAVLNRGDVEAVRKLAAFQQLVDNPDMLALIKTAGMVSESTSSSVAVETVMASKIVDIWGRVQRVKNNRRVQEILSDPEFQQKVQSSNPVDLLTNAPLLELANIIFSDTASPGNTSPVNAAVKESGGTQPADTLEIEPKYELKIFSWVDENGRIHYSDVDQEP